MKASTIVPEIAAQVAEPMLAEQALDQIRAAVPIAPRLSGVSQVALATGSQSLLGSAAR